MYMYNQPGAALILDVIRHCSFDHIKDQLALLADIIVIIDQLWPLVNVLKRLINLMKVFHRLSFKALMVACLQ